MTTVFNYKTVFLKNRSASRFLENIHLNAFPKALGGASRDRTDDPLLAKQVLSQLSYGPGYPNDCSKWWVWLDLNQRPHAYQACALTS